ncbi:MAG: amidase [Azospirillaceae bacterium]|nr:amidase [Azospirillaceae bacterium]
MTEDDYLTFDGIGLAQAIAAGEVSPEEALDAALARLDAVDPTINAVVLRAEAFARARLRDGVGTGPFAGVPFLVKDLSLPIAGLTQTSGSAFFKGYVPNFDSTLAERQQAAGLVVIGRTASTELGLGPVTETRVYGPCRNPWDPSRQTGGSSGGSAAAVAAGIVPLAHATDGGGSIRMPAAHCGLFGLKPSRGRLPAGPFAGEAWNGLAVPHVVTRSVRDSAAMLDATAGPAPGDPYAAPGAGGPFLPQVGRDPPSLRIALSTTAPHGGPVHREVRAAVEAAGQLLESLGHVVEVAAIEVDLEAFYRHYWLIAGANVAVAVSARAQVLGRQPGPDDLEPATRAILERAGSASAEDFTRAVQWAHSFGRRVGAFFTQWDVALTPVLTNPPLPVGSLAMGTADFATYDAMLQAERPFTAVYNMSGAPAMSVPLAWTASGLPIGVHFGAAIGREDLLFRLAGQLERSAAWSYRRPLTALWRPSQTRGKPGSAHPSGAAAADRRRRVECGPSALPLLG